jgi:hypothetical protein
MVLTKRVAYDLCDVGGESRKDGRFAGWGSSLDNQAQLVLVSNRFISAGEQIYSETSLVSFSRGRDPPMDEQVGNCCHDRIYHRSACSLY